MKEIKFNATCPFEIGDKIVERRESWDNLCGQRIDFPIIHTITDILCQYYVRSGKTEFLFELNNNGKYVHFNVSGQRPESV